MLYPVAVKQTEINERSFYEIIIHSFLSKCASGNYTYSSTKKSPTIFGSFRYANNFYMIMNKLDITLKDLINKIKLEQLRMPEFVIKQLVYRIINELSYLNQAGLSHGDLKPENCLLSTDTYRAPVELDILM